MKWALFKCRACGYTTKQLANAQVTHLCGKGQRPKRLERQEFQQ